MSLWASISFSVVERNRVLIEIRYRGGCYIVSHEEKSFRLGCSVHHDIRNEVHADTAVVVHLLHYQ